MYDGVLGGWGFGSSKQYYYYYYWTFSQPEKKNNLEKIKWMNKAIALKNPCIFTCDLL